MCKLYLDTNILNKYIDNSQLHCIVPARQQSQTMAEPSEMLQQAWFSPAWWNPFTAEQWTLPACSYIRSFIHLTYKGCVYPWSFFKKAASVCVLSQLLSDKKASGYSSNNYLVWNFSGGIGAVISWESNRRRRKPCWDMLRRMIGKLLSRNSKLACVTMYVLNASSTRVKTPKWSSQKKNKNCNSIRKFLFNYMYIILFLC